MTFARRFLGLSDCRKEHEQPLPDVQPARRGSVEAPAFLRSRRPLDAPNALSWRPRRTGSIGGQASFFLNSVDSLKLGVSDAFVIDETQLESKMRTQSRLQKISTAISLFSMAMSFSVLGLMIVVNQHDGGASIPGGILGILLGATFLIAACLHLKSFQGGFQLEEVPADEIVSEMQQAAKAMCSF